MDSIFNRLTSKKIYIKKIYILLNFFKKCANLFEVKKIIKLRVIQI